MAEDDEAEVVPLRVADVDDDQPVRPPENRVWCMHRKTRLDVEARRVYCRECGREVDAFTVLEHWANEVEFWITARKEAQRRARVAQDNLQELLRDERNAKARKRRRERA